LIFDVIKGSVRAEGEVSMKTSFLAILLSVLMIGVSHADSCWTHNGSLMRLKADGNGRWMYYENPKQSLQSAGIYSGTLLFANGTG